MRVVVEMVVEKRGVFFLSLLVYHVISFSGYPLMKHLKVLKDLKVCPGYAAARLRSGRECRTFKNVKKSRNSRKFGDILDKNVTQINVKP